MKVGDVPERGEVWELRAKFIEQDWGWWLHKVIIKDAETTGMIDRVWYLDMNGIEHVCGRDEFIVYFKPTK